MQGEGEMNSLIIAAIVIMALSFCAFAYSAYLVFIECAKQQDRIEQREAENPVVKAAGEVH